MSTCAACDVIWTAPVAKCPECGIDPKERIYTKSDMEAACDLVRNIRVETFCAKCAKEIRSASDVGAQRAISSTVAPSGNVAELHAYLAEDCVRLQGRECTTLRCLKRGGYQLGAKGFDPAIATCEAYETAKFLPCANPSAIAPQGEKP